jgi:hypothetical protein
MSSPAKTLGSWVRIPCETWMFACVYSAFMLYCVISGLATGSSPIQGVLPDDYENQISEFINSKWAQAREFNPSR